MAVRKHLAKLFIRLGLGRPKYWVLSTVFQAYNLPQRRHQEEVSC